MLFIAAIAASALSASGLFYGISASRVPDHLHLLGSAHADPLDHVGFGYS
jgi:hypothetical protein